MTERWRLVFEPVDTLFFGDGRPFRQDDQGAANATSIFPALPATMAGAARVYLANAMGWQGGDWASKPTLAALLGDRGMPGALRFDGPYLYRLPKATRASRPAQYLFPLPTAQLLAPLMPTNDGHERPTQYRMRLKSTEKRYETDLGSATALPEAPKDPSIEHQSDVWLTGAGMAAFCTAEKIPGHGFYLAPEGLMGRERRVGIEVDDADRSAKPHMLYSADHVRLPDELALSVHVTLPGEAPTGLPTLTPALVPLGGEGRMAHVRAERIGPADPFAPTGNAADEQGFRQARKPAGRGEKKKAAHLRYALVLLTPAVLGEPLRPGMTIAGLSHGDATEPKPLPGRLEFAFADRTIVYGGFSTGQHASAGRQSARRLVPAGSVLCMTMSGEGAGKELDIRAIGEDTAWGFGQVAMCSP